MAVPYTFGTATAAIPLSQLDSNFNTAITIGNTAVQLGNTITSFANVTLVNATVTSLSTPITAAQGGTGLATLTVNNVVLGNGTSNVQLVAPGTTGNVLVSNGTTWISNAAATTAQVYPGAGIANSTGTAWGTSYTANGTGTVVALNNTPTLTNPTITNYVETPYSANSSTAITLALTNGTVQIITLTGTCTITMPTAVSGKSFILLLKTGAGSYTVTWTTVQWPSGTAPTLTSTASKMDKFVFTSDGTNWYGSVAGQNYSV
jgi:hypothetical protein